MSITRSTIAAISITAGIAGALIMSALPAQAHPGHDGDQGGNRQGGGGFTVQCDFSHSASVDPIVMPGHAAMSHLHEFFGNTTTNENSTGASLLAGSTTCSDSNNLSAYWVPALYQDERRVWRHCALAHGAIQVGRSVDAEVRNGVRELRPDLNPPCIRVARHHAVKRLINRALQNVAQPRKPHILDDLR